MNSLLSQLVVYEPRNTKIRLGSFGDGGYVIVDGYDYDFYIGCGVGGNIKFDCDFIDKHQNINGVAFDGTINHAPPFPNKISFVRKNIGTSKNENETDLMDETANYNDIFIKMDIEGHEWKWINAFNNLSKIKQLVLEVHGLFDTNPDGWMSIGNYKYQEMIDAIAKLNTTHHLVHFHSNDAAEYKVVDGFDVPTVGELTFIRKTDCEINGFNKTKLPIEGLDCVNGNDRPPLSFSYYPFCSCSA